MARQTDTKERLLEAGIDLLWEQSLATASVDAICERANVRKGSFYHFFPTKADLVCAAMEAHWESGRANHDRIFSPSVPPLERLDRYFEFIYQKQLEGQKKAGRVLGCPFMSIGSACTKEDEKIRDKSTCLLKRIQKYLESTLRDGQADGSIPVKDVPAAAEALLNYISGAETQARIQNDLRPLARLAEGARGILGLAPARAEAGASRK